MTSISSSRKRKRDGGVGRVELIKKNGCLMGVLLYAVTCGERSEEPPKVATSYIERFAFFLGTSPTLNERLVMVKKCQTLLRAQQNGGVMKQE